MSVAKLSRAAKRQLGQFLTPSDTARRLVEALNLGPNDRVLEPGFGGGAFLIPLIERFMAMQTGSVAERLEAVLTRNVFGIELDAAMFQQCLASIEAEFGALPPRHNLIQGDFLDAVRWETPPASGLFSHVVGNPPFGGSLNPDREDEYDRLFGERGGQKIKKETYAFFIIKSAELMQPGGKLLFLCSDSLLTINTMRGLRDWLLARGEVVVDYLPTFSEETTQDVIVLSLGSGRPGQLSVFGESVDVAAVSRTPNHSWLVTRETAKYFAGPQIGNLLIATGGMTTGRNEYFVREIDDGRIREPYEFRFSYRAISIERELERARLGKLSDAARRSLAIRTTSGELERFVQLHRLADPLEIRLPHEDYRYYNKSVSTLLYAPPTHAIYWRDEGDAVLTYKKTGNWYLRGVGGSRYFGREGLTWALVASRIWARFLPAGYILDSGAPAAFLRPGVAEEELYFVLGWAVTKTCSRLLKGVINHTRNIQGKDFERLPYPFWVANDRKPVIVAHVQELVRRAMRMERFTHVNEELEWLEREFEFREGEFHQPASLSTPPQSQLPVWTII